MRLDLDRLFLQPAFGRFELRLQVLVGADDVADHVDDQFGHRLVARARFDGQQLAGLLELGRDARRRSTTLRWPALAAAWRSRRPASCPGGRGGRPPCRRRRTHMPMPTPAISWIDAQHAAAEHQ